MCAGPEVDPPERESFGGQADLDTALRGVTQAARQVITGVDHASITVLGPDNELVTFAPTDEVIAQADKLQYTYCEGPCVQAATSGTEIVATNMATDDRWPHYGPSAGELGIVGQVSLPLRCGGKNWGALNLYSLTTSGFDDVSLETAELMAGSASALLGLSHQVVSLSAALATRTSIGAAIGVVMERYGVDQNSAFDVLVRKSQHANVKLRLVAQQILDEVGRH
jgi:GAF domain-containing protein